MERKLDSTIYDATTEIESTSSVALSTTILTDTKSNGISSSNTPTDIATSSLPSSNTMTDLTTSSLPSSNTMTDLKTSSLPSSNTMTDLKTSSLPSSSTMTDMTTTIGISTTLTLSKSTTTITENPTETCVTQRQFQDGKNVDIPCFNDTYLWIKRPYQMQIMPYNIIGNQYIHELSSFGYSILRVDLMDQTMDWRCVEYNFSVENSAFKYRLNITCREGCDIDSLWTGLFSTYDEDNDNWAQRDCAEDFSGGWWYSADAYCTEGNLNGMYTTDGSKKNEKRGIFFFHWHMYEPLTFARMMVRQP
ncbi:uncharacterized protein LOC134236651 [Saccostrea cucullata]|uniref:uncharacterized protein LOC134236651 n=1 Tax=Saccostrea cuccullata TaxID=36930 RepID=UPI002ED1DCDE